MSPFIFTGRLPFKVGRGSKKEFSVEMTLKGVNKSNQLAISNPSKDAFI